MANTARNRPGTETTTVLDDKNNPLVTLQSRYEHNKKNINTVVSVVLFVIIGYFAYTKLYKEPREDKAGAAVAFAQRYFEADSLDKALNGDGQHAGFLKVMKKYSGTSTENMCHYYAGICYLKMGDAKKAIKHLEDFNGAGTVVAYGAWGALGDAYMESGNSKKGIEYYEKASSDKKNKVYTPLYLFRLGVANQLAGKDDEAKKAFTRIRDEYPQSAEARDMDKYLARLGVLK